MRPLTLRQPKPLLQVNGVSLLARHLLRLHAAGVRDVVINIAYLGEQIRQAIGTGGEFGLNVRYSEEPEPLETGGALSFALPLLGDDPFLLVNGDIWTDYPFERLQMPLASSAHLVMTGNPAHHPQGDFVLTPSGHINSLPEVQGTITGEGLTFTGLSLIHPRAIADYPRRRAKFPLREVFAWLLPRGELTGEFYSGQWTDVGTPERLDALREQQ